MAELMEEHGELQSEIVRLCNSFVEDVGERVKTLDVQYLTGLKKFYQETIESIEPTSSATPKLSYVIVTYIFFLPLKNSQLSSTESRY